MIIEVGREIMKLDFQNITKTRNIPQMKKTWNVQKKLRANDRLESRWS